MIENTVKSGLLLKDNLIKLGFLKNGIVESIVCTFDVNGKPNAAPMGVTTEDMENLILQPYRETLTYRNLLLTGFATINITSDPTVFYQTVFKNVDPRWSPHNHLFTDSRFVNAPRLKNADACLEVAVTEVASKGAHMAKFNCAVMKVFKATGLKPKAYCRAAFALIESIIHATRIQALIPQGDIDSAENLIKLVHHYADLVKRVAPESIYQQMINDILGRITSWKAGSEKSL